MHLYGNLPEIASVGVLFLFALYLGLYLALFGLLFGAIRRHWSLTAALISSPLLWVAVEFARDRVTGFPWDLLGYTQIDNLDTGENCAMDRRLWIVSGNRCSEHVVGHAHCETSQDNNLVGSIACLHTHGICDLAAIQRPGTSAGRNNRDGSSGAGEFIGRSRRAPGEQGSNAGVLCHAKSTS